MNEIIISPSVREKYDIAKLYEPIIQNDVEKLTGLLLSYPTNFDINQPLRGIEEETLHKNALMIACSLDCFDIVDYLLTHMNVDINLQDKNGETALFQASAIGSVKIVELLLNHNAKLDIENKHKMTSLIISSSNGHANVVKVLLEKGKAYNVNHQDILCKTALSFAAHVGNPYIVELLLNHGANVDIADKLGWTPLMLAAFFGKANVCRQLLFAKADKNLKTEDNKTASTLAKEGGFNHIAEMIEKFNHGKPNVLISSSYAKDYVPKKSYFGIGDSRRISTTMRLRSEMLPRERNNWWVYLSWIVTVFFLDQFLIKYGKMNNEKVRQAWREKVTLCYIVLVASLLVAMSAFGSVSLACSSTPPIPLPIINKFWGENNKQVMIVRGEVYNVGGYFKSSIHRPISPLNDEILEPIINQYYGKDVGELFPVDNLAIGCNKDSVIHKLSCTTKEKADERYHCHTSRNSLKTLKSLSINRFVSISWDEIKNSLNRKLFVYRNKVYDLTEYLSPTNTDRWLGNNNITTIWLEGLIGKDVTFDILKIKNNDFKEIAKCFEHFRIGEVEGVQFGCTTVTVIILVIFTSTSILVIIKLFSALTYDYVSKKLVQTKKNNVYKNVIIMVPCYSEGYESMKNSFDSLAATHYPNENKLFFVIADGNVTGDGNNKPTPDILLDLIIPFRENFNNVKARSYLSIGDRSKRRNMAKAYAGYYKYQDKNIPTILVVKVGNPEESKYPKAGRRGKRDSQLILIHLLQHAFNNSKMSHLEFDIFEKVYRLTKKTIDEYEFVVMVDADTIVKDNSINHMANCMINDPSIIGLCGETQVSNKFDNWVTMIQVFEYYLTHRLGKTFESVYSNVLCLPGCFCMYRVFSCNYDGYRVPILIDENIVMNYSTDKTDTLHQKNLLLLGEDRYLTTLMLRAFPKRKTLYCPSAICKTIVPTGFKTLLSQRRRWINGTIHNLFELLVSPELPGRFCFSLQFVILLELIGTFTSPFTSLYVLFTIIGLAVGYSFQLSAIFSAATYSLHSVLAMFISYANPSMIMWFFAFIFSIPIWYIILPLYAFWNFDDFSWGSNGKLNNDEGYDDTIFDKFDPKSVPFKRWDQWAKSTYSHYHM